jgi:hypothetical protein
MPQPFANRDGARMRRMWSGCGKFMPPQSRKTIAEDRQRAVRELLYDNGDGHFQAVGVSEQVVSGKKPVNLAVV